MSQPDVVLFMRSLHRQLGGGGRAVLDRARLYAELGHRVHLVVLGLENASDADWLRREGMLHRAVRVLYVARDAPGWRDHLAAARRQPLAFPIPHGPGVTVTLESGGVRERRSYAVDGVERAQVATGPNGRTTRATRLAADGRVEERWHYDPQGRVAIVDGFDPDTQVPARRRYVVEGRYAWLDVDLTLSEGRGRARHPERRDGPVTTFAEVIAAWLDRELADRPELVVFADGENVSQHVLRAMRHPGVRGVCVLHNAHTEAPHTADAPTKENWAAFLDDRRNVHVVVCLSARQQRDLTERYPWMPLRVVHHAVPARPRPDVRPDPMVAVFVGRLAAQKRLAHLVDAFALVVAEEPSARLHVYGSGSEQADLEARIEAAGIGGAVELKGFTNDAPAAFASATCAVMTSLYEGLPLTLTESMSVGTPFVAYDIDYGPAEVVRDGVDGVLVRPGDVRAMADGILSILRDPGRAKAMRERALEVTERFSPARYAEAWTRVLDDAVTAGRRPLVIDLTEDRSVRESARV